METERTAGRSCVQKPSQEASTNLTIHNSATITIMTPACLIKPIGKIRSQQKGFFSVITMFFLKFWSQRSSHQSHSLCPYDELHGYMDISDYIKQKPELGLRQER